jgi:hypothetical protein
MEEVTVVQDVEQAADGKFIVSCTQPDTAFMTHSHCV